MRELVTRCRAVAFATPVVSPLQHTPCILTCQRQGSKKLDVFQNNISFSSQNNLHTKHQHWNTFCLCTILQFSAALKPATGDAPVSMVLHQRLGVLRWNIFFLLKTIHTMKCVLVFVQCLVHYITMHQSFDTRWCNCFDAPVSCLCPRCCTRAKSFRPRPARLPQTSPLDNGSHDGQWPAYDRI